MTNGQRAELYRLHRVAEPTPKQRKRRRRLMRELARGRGRR